jgi:hypothetical protein
VARDHADGAATILGRPAVPPGTVGPMRRRCLEALVCVLGIAAVSACGSTRTVAHKHSATPAAAATGGRAVAATSYPVYQLPPGHITLADAATPRGPVAIVLHRIRYYGHVSLCVSESNANGGTDQSCANYPIGPKSNQNIGDSPVWWATDYLAACTKPRFQVVSGVVLRPGISAWLRTPNGVSRMPTAVIPKAFGVAGGLVYATITTGPEAVILRDATGKTVYAAPVEPLTSFPTLGCGTVHVGATTVSSSGAIVLNSPGQHVVP